MGGTCVGVALRDCGDQICDEGTDRCRCPGCLVGGVCYAADAVDPANPCRACNPFQSITQFSAKIGAACGASAGECSAGGSCDAQGLCNPNDYGVDQGCGMFGATTCINRDHCDGAGHCVSEAAKRVEECNLVDDDCNEIIDDIKDDFGATTDCG
jgi:hypothetical protein